MDEGFRLVAKLLDGEIMAAVCREFGISRKTGSKIFNRYKDIGIEGLQDRNHTPYRYANKRPFQVEKTIRSMKQDHQTWDAPKIRDKLVKAFPMSSPPAQSTIHAVLDRNGLVNRRRHRRYKATGAELADAKSPNELWCADCKGEFKLGNKKYCYPSPLPIIDQDICSSAKLSSQPRNSLPLACLSASLKNSSCP
jgi:hypothetical protein